MSDFKISFVGDASVGKTSIISRYSQNKFMLDQPPTIGASNYHFTVPVDDLDIVMNVWDTAGQERFRSLVPLYTRDAKIVVLVFDIGESSTFDSLEEWYEKLKSDVTLKAEIFLVANKIDLEYAIQMKDIKDWAHSKNINHVFFTSAAENREIDNLFKAMAEYLADLSNKHVDMDQPVQAISLTPEKEQKKGCC